MEWVNSNFIFTSFPLWRQTQLIKNDVFESYSSLEKRFQYFCHHDHKKFLVILYRYYWRLQPDFQEMDWMETLILSNNISIQWTPLRTLGLTGGLLKSVSLSIRADSCSFIITEMGKKYLKLFEASGKQHLQFFFLVTNFNLEPNDLTGGRRKSCILWDFGVGSACLQRWRRRRDGERLVTSICLRFFSLCTLPLCSPSLLQLFTCRTQLFTYRQQYWCHNYFNL